VGAPRGQVHHSLRRPQPSGHDRALSAIRVGGQEYAPQAWESISDDSHHREGVLVFAREAPDGATLDAGTVELVMKGIANVAERVFRWQWPVRSG
jgi:hypothetical protein